MPATVTNHGTGGHFPCKLGSLFFERGRTRVIEDDAAIEELRRFPRLKITYLPQDKKKSLPKRDSSGLTIQMLRRMAHRAGIKGFFTMPKVRLIEKLGEKT